MSIPVPPVDAVALARASADAGVIAARLGYQLTTQALGQSGAPAVIPLLVLESVAIAGGFASYAATGLAWRAAQAAAADGSP